MGIRIRIIASFVTFSLGVLFGSSITGTPPDRSVYFYMAVLTAIIILNTWKQTACEPTQP